MDHWTQRRFQMLQTKHVYLMLPVDVNKTPMQAIRLRAVPLPRPSSPRHLCERRQYQRCRHGRCLLRVRRILPKYLRRKTANRTWRATYVAKETTPHRNRATTFLKTTNVSAAWIHCQALHLLAHPAAPNPRLSY
jgi:hypothetical protein